MALTIAEHKNLVKEYEQSLPYLRVNLNDKTIVFATPNEKCFYFAVSIQTREPKTNQWINSFSPGDVFFDIGANNGIYGLLAAVLRDCTVHAFEPHFGSYYVMTLNIYANKLQNRMFAIPTAISDRDGFGTLYLSATYAGKSLNNFGAARPHDDPLWNATIPQASITTTLDHYCAETGVIPNHIKVDVDGLEPQIVNGGLKTLENSAVKSIMLELDEKDNAHRQVFTTLYKLGFVRYERDPCGIFFYR